MVVYCRIKMRIQHTEKLGVPVIAPVISASCRKIKPTIESLVGRPLKGDQSRILQKSQGKLPCIHFDRVKFDELAALKRMLNIGAMQTPPKVDKVPHIPILKENNTRKGFFYHGDFLALRAALPEYLKGFVTFAYKTGWRVSEISNLTWSNVDLSQGIVRLEAGETKNDEGRTVYQ